MKRRELLRLGASVALAAACAPATAPSAAPAATQAAATAPAVIAPQAPPAAATPSPTPQRTPFNIASMKDPLIENHVHPIVPQQGDQLKYFDGLVQLMDQNNVAYSVMHRNAQWVSSAPTFGKDHDDWVRAAMDRHPGRILGGLGGFDPASSDAPAYVRTQLQAGKWSFVGELDLRNPGPKTQIPINSPAVLEIAKVAAEFKVPLVFHYNFDYPSGDPQVGLREMEDAVAKSPNTTFVLAHFPPPPEMMRAYPNLWGEMTLFSPNAEQALPELRRETSVIDRIVLCLTDMQTPDLKVIAGLSQPMSYADAIAATRKQLATFTAEQRDKMAFKNAMRLLKLS